MLLPLPSEFTDYLKAGGADYLEFDQGALCLQLWPADDAGSLNRDYEVAFNAPGFVGFGSDGGDEMFAFDGTGAVFKIPFVPMASSEARFIAKSWRDLLDRRCDHKP